MAEDYYTQWLGIARGTRPPDYYTLLALPRFVNARHAIEAAATAQLAKLDPHAIQPDRDRAAAATEIMNEVANARTVLSDPTQRNAYNDHIAQQLGIAELPSPDAPDMADTDIGTPPLASDAPDLSDLAAAERGPTVVSGQTTGDPDDVPDELFEGQTPLQEMDAAFTPPRARRVTIPFSLVCVLGGLGLVLVVAIVIVCIAWLNPETASDSPRPAPPPVVTPRPAPPPPPPKAFEFVEYFDSPELGIAFDLRAPGEGPDFGVSNGCLWLGTTTENSVRVDVLPRDEEVLFRQVALKARIDQGAKLSVGIATAAMLTITSSEDGLGIHADPGQPVAAAGSEGWPTLPRTSEVSIELIREEGSVEWKVNGRTVATSPDIAPHAWPSLVLSSNGPAGRRVGVDSLHVIYDPDEPPGE